MTEFRPFSKLSRLFRGIVITEKIDGTNASIFIGEDGEFLCGSRTRWVTPGDDNFGFAAWAHENKDSLLMLGPGHHFGEWWGSGIQRKYGLNERRFSLFNTSRWSAENVPSCCSVVPVLYQGPFEERAIYDAQRWLETNGSAAAPGYKNPEGIVVYHTAGNVSFKYTFDGDGHKGAK